MADIPTVTAPATVTPPVDAPRTKDPVSPVTTHEEDLFTRSQRRINLIWELTQALVAISVVWAAIVAAFALPIQNMLLANAFFLVVGFYFGRTNHARSGGTARG